MLNAGQLHHRYRSMAFEAGVPAGVAAATEAGALPDAASRARAAGQSSECAGLRFGGTPRLVDGPGANVTSCEYGSCAAGAAGSAQFASPVEIALPRLGLVTPSPFADADAALRSTVPVRRGFGAVQAALKRAFDILFAAALLLLALPLLAAVVAALQLDSPGPVFFIQQRLGRGGRRFGCIKLRTMRVDAEGQFAALLAACPQARREWAATRKLRRDPRVSPLGRLVRKLSLDELPQLANVLAGEMSVVGPRPIVAAEIPRYGAFYADYCAVKPGLTGLWQVSGRSDVGYGERVQLDRHYSRHASFLLDLRIVARTVPAVLCGSGSY